MSIPIIMLQKDQSIEGYEKKYNPKDPIYYVLTSDGLFLRKRNKFYDCVHEAEPPKTLGGAREGLHLRCKPVPRNILNEIIAFLAEVCRQYEAEGVVMLYYHADKKEWMYIIPEQETVANGLSVDYEMPKTPEGWTLFGSVHSHAKASAFQSGTDHKDECHFEGIHITVGKLPDNPELHVRFHACGEKWEFKNQAELVEPVVHKYELPKGAMDKVKVKQYSTVGYKGGFAMQTSFADDDEMGTRRDGTVWCQVQREAVAPYMSRKDWHEPGKILRYDGKRYVKVAEGDWRLCGDQKKQQRSTSPQSQRQKTSQEPSGTDDEEHGAHELHIDDTEEILNVRDQFFGQGAHGETELFGGLKYVRTIWGWETEHEVANGRWLLTLNERRQHFEKLSEEEQSKLLTDMNSEMLSELLKTGWLPQDCLMSLLIEEQCTLTEEEMACGNG